MADKLSEGEGASRPGDGVALTGDESFRPMPSSLPPCSVLATRLSASGASLGPSG